MDKRELDHVPNQELERGSEEQQLLSRRDFLAGLRKWSAAVIGVAVAGSVLLPGETAASGWVNGRGSWVNGHGGGWVNRGGSWVNGGGGGSWYNRGVAWANRGASWANRAGGGGSWVNRRGW
jgi:hypothetical protein